MEETVNRTCKKCGETKPIEMFTKDKGCKHGYQWRCRQCTTDYKTKLRKSDLEKAHQIDKMYRDKNRDRILSKRRINYKRNLKHFRGKSLEYAIKQKERVTDNYVVQLLAQHGIPTKTIRQYPELIEAKKIQIKLKRLLDENNYRFKK